MSWNESLVLVLAPCPCVHFGSIQEGVSKANNTWFHKLCFRVGRRYRITERHTWSRVHQPPVPGALFSVCPTTPPAVADVAFHLVLHHLHACLSQPTPATSGSELPGRIGGPSPLVRFLYPWHQVNAPAASSASQEPDPARCRSDLGLQRGKTRGLLRESDKS